MQSQGRDCPDRQTGKPAELLLNFILGFILGFKLIGLFLTTPDPNFKVQDYILSGQGSWLAGLGLGLLFAGLKWYEKNKQKAAAAAGEDGPDLAA